MGTAAKTENNAKYYSNSTTTAFAAPFVANLFQTYSPQSPAFHVGAFFSPICFHCYVLATCRHAYLLLEHVFRMYELLELAQHG